MLGNVTQDNPFSMTIPRFTTKQWLVAILIIGFIATFAYALYFQVEPVVDARGYDQIGANIAAGHGYQLDASVPPAEDLAISFMGPGYQYFLGFLYSVFGHHLPVVWFFQALLHTITALFLFLIASRLFGPKGERVGLIAAALYLFCIDLLQMPAMTMTETLYLFSLSLTTYVFVRFYQSSTWLLAALLGIVGGLSVMIRPTALLFLAAVAAAVFFKREFLKTVVVLLCAVLVIAPWTIRNYLVYDQFILTTAAGGYGLWLGNNPGAEGGAHPTEEIVAYTSTHTFLETSHEGVRQVKHFIMTEPLEATKIMIWKGTAYFSAARPYAFWFYFDDHPIAQKVVLTLSVAWSSVLLILGMAGAWILWRSKEPLTRWIVILAVTLPLAVIPVIVETRYRLPAYLFFSLFSGYLLAHAYSLYWNDRRAFFGLAGVTAGSVALIVFTTGFDVFRNIALITSRLGL